MTQKKHKIILWIPAQQEEKKLRIELEGHGFECITCLSMMEINNTALKYQHNIGLVIIDESAGDIPNICLEIKSSGILHSYLMVLAHQLGEKSESEALENGADMFIDKSLRLPILAKRIVSVLSRKR